MAFNPLKANHKVRIEERSAGTNGESTSTTWTLYVEHWAAIAHSTGSERFEAAQTKASLPTTFRLRFDSKTRGIEPTMRVVFDGRWFEILSREPDPRQEDVVLTCVERVGEVPT